LGTSLAFGAVVLGACAQPLPKAVQGCCRQLVTELAAVAGLVVVNAAAAMRVDTWSFS
jgi:hypothetical protein